ncbi:MAG: hypothetical protein OQL19_01115 [Gammaproteobacteria bacterium]|nr:hypothetical protein [Gammaproteobacteria bacterium]
MKDTNKKNLAVNALILLMLLLLFFSGSLMWTQHNQYHKTFWNTDSNTQYNSTNHMNWLNSNSSR